MMTNDPLDAYLARFQAALVGMTLAERHDIVEEIRTHVHERVATGGIPVAEALAKLGPAEQLAREYCRGALVRRANALMCRKWGALSPWLTLRAAFAWAMTGVHGIGVFVTAVFGYALGCALIVWGLLNVFLPDTIGLWMGPDFTLGFRPEDVAQGRPALGGWFQPVVFGVGALLLGVTTAAVRALGRRFQYWRTNAPRPAAILGL
jgi:HAAS domain-containing protein